MCLPLLIILTHPAVGGEREEEGRRGGLRSLEVQQNELPQGKQKLIYFMETIYSLFHKTLPKSILQLHRNSARFFLKRRYIK